VPVLRTVGPPAPLWTAVAIATVPELGVTAKPRLIGGWSAVVVG
jgi:hypothetical protein